MLPRVCPPPPPLSKKRGRGSWGVVVGVPPRPSLLSVPPPLLALRQMCVDPSISRCSSSAGESFSLLGGEEFEGSSPNESMSEEGWVFRECAPPPLHRPPAPRPPRLLASLPGSPSRTVRRPTQIRFVRRCWTTSILGVGAWGGLRNHPLVRKKRKRLTFSASPLALSPDQSPVPERESRAAPSNQGSRR